MQPICVTLSTALVSHQHKATGIDLNHWSPVVALFLPERGLLRIGWKADGGLVPEDEE